MTAYFISLNELTPAGGLYKDCCGYREGAADTGGSRG